MYLVLNSALFMIQFQFGMINCVITLVKPNALTQYEPADGGKPNTTTGWLLSQAVVNENERIQMGLSKA